MDTEKICVAIYNENCIQKGHAVRQSTLDDYDGDWRDGGDWTVYEGTEADIIEYAAGMVREQFTRPFMCRSAQTLLKSIFWDESRIDRFIDNRGVEKKYIIEGHASDEIGPNYNWDSSYCGSETLEFDTMEEAEEAITELKKSGPDFENCDYRVSEIEK